MWKDIYSGYLLYTLTKVVKYYTKRDISKQKKEKIANFANEISHPIMNRRILTSLLFLFIASLSYAKMDYDGLEKKFDLSSQKKEILKECKGYMRQMDAALKDTSIYNNVKRKRIANLKVQLSTCKDYSKRYKLLIQLHDEYAILSLPVSLQYAKDASKLAKQNNDEQAYYNAIIMQAALLVKGGYFKECSDLLSFIPKDKLSNNLLLRYYETEFDMNFEDGFVFPTNKSVNDQFSLAMNNIYKETVARFPNSAYVLTKMKMEYYFHLEKYQEATKYALKLMQYVKPGTEEYAYHLGNVGYTSMGAGYYVQAIKYMSLSTEEQVKLGSVEYPVMRKLAEICTVMGLHDDAFRYSTIGMENAKRYNSLYRIYEVSQFYPLIHDRMYETISRQHNYLMATVIVLVLLLLALGISMVVIRKKSFYLKRQNNVIKLINQRLAEANGINITMLGNLISQSSSKREKEDNFYKSVSRRLAISDYAGAKDLINRRPDKSKEDYELLDNIILEVFPEFVNQFYELLKPECRPKDIKTDKLTPEMRIFGLIRFGISNNNQLASSLNYSVNTIKHYKTIVFNSSNYSNEEFYKHLMQIHYKPRENN